MTSKAIFLSGACLCSMSGSSQLAPAVEWQDCFGGTEQEWAGSCAMALDGGYFLGGSTASEDGDATGVSHMMDFWVVKLDPNGQLLWQEKFGGDDVESINSLAATSDGGCIAVGYTYSDNGDVTDSHGEADGWVVKLDQNGSLEWQRALGSSGLDRLYSVVETDNGYIIAGYAENADGDVTVNHGSLDAWVVKLDLAGALVWERTYGGYSSDFAFSIKASTNGGYVMAGYAGSSDGDVTGVQGIVDYWIVKLDDQGGIEWQRTYGGELYEEAKSIACTDDGGYVVAGHTRSTGGDVTNNHGGTDYWIIRLDPNGDLLWQRTFGGSGEDRAKNIIVDNDGGFLISGDTDNISEGGMGSLGWIDIWLMKLDQNGQLLWQKSIGGQAADGPGEIIRTQNEIIIFGGSYSCSFGNPIGQTSIDFLLVKLTYEVNAMIGSIYLDMNANSVKDAGEMVLKQHRVERVGGTEFDWTSNDGHYALHVLGSGVATLEPEPLQHFAPVPGSRSVHFEGLLETDSLNDFAFQPVGVVNDLSVSIAPLTAFRPGFTGRYLIHYQNIGNTVIAPTVGFQFVHPFTYHSASLEPTAITPDSVSWQLQELQHFEEGTIEVTVNNSTAAVLGSTIIAAATIFPLEGDANIADNKALWWVTITGSYDPNDIQVDRPEISPEELADGVDLTYLIRFQNTGTDTAFTVRVENPVPVNADFNTFDFIAASHPVQISYTAATSKLSFLFNNILLPDSNTNEPQSHGYILYRIKPRSTLVLGDSVLNQVGIYFDYNLPIITNVAHTVIEQSVGLPSVTAGSALTLFPNPTTGEVMLRVPRPVSNGSVTVTDAMGRTLLRTTMNGSAHRLDLRPMPSGVYLIAVQDDEGGFQQRAVVE